MQLELDPDQIRYIPANVEAEIKATTAFGNKFVDLIYPTDPSAKRLSGRCSAAIRNVSTEVNTVFENLVNLLNQIDLAKLNAVLTTLAEGLGGQGERIGEAITAANQVLLAAQSAQRDDPRGLPGSRRLQRHLRRCGTGHPARPGRGQHHEHHDHEPRQRPGFVAAQRNRTVELRHRSAGAQQGQPDRRHQHA